MNEKGPNIDQIDDCAKDGGEEFFTKMHCVLNRIPIESFKIRNSSAVHLGEKFLSAILSAIVYCVDGVDSVA